MSKKASFTELPGIFARPIIKSEIDRALFVMARAWLPEGASPEEVETQAVRWASFRPIYSVPSRSLRSGRNVPILLKNSGWRPLGPSARKLRICRAPTLNHSCALGLDPESIFHRFLRQRVFQQYPPLGDD